MVVTALKITDLSEIDAAAEEFLALCKNHFFFAFYGKVGAGKTTFVKALCKVLNIEDQVSSPTFALVNEYRLLLPVSGRDTVYHADLYRLKNLEEALDVGIEEYFYSPNAFCFIEWPELIESVLPESTVKVTIEATPDQTRVLNIQIPKT